MGASWLHPNQNPRTLNVDQGVGTLLGSFGGDIRDISLSVSGFGLRLDRKEHYYRYESIDNSRQGGDFVGRIPTPCAREPKPDDTYHALILSAILALSKRGLAQTVGF